MDENSILDPGQLYESNGEHSTSPPDAPPPLPPSPVSGGPHRKKSASFQITKVQYPRRGSNDCGDDSNDDSHTEDTSDITDSVDQPSDTSGVVHQNTNIDSVANRFTVVRTTDSTENSHTYKRGRWLIEDGYQEEQMGRELKGVFVPRTLNQVEEVEDRDTPMSCEDGSLAGLQHGSRTSVQPSSVVSNVVTGFSVSSAEKSNITGQFVSDGMMPNAADGVRVHDMMVQNYPQQPVSYAAELRQADPQGLASQSIAGATKSAGGQNQFQQQPIPQLASGNVVYQNNMPPVPITLTSQNTNQLASAAPPMQTVGPQSQADLKGQFTGSQQIPAPHSFLPAQQASHVVGMSHQYQPITDMPVTSLQSSSVGQQPAFKTASTTSTGNLVTVSSRTDYSMQQTGQTGNQNVPVQGPLQTQLNTYQTSQVAPLPSTEKTQAASTQCPFGTNYPSANQNEIMSSVPTANFSQHQPVQQIHMNQTQNETARESTMSYPADSTGCTLATNFKSQVSISGLGGVPDAVGYQPQGSTVTSSNSAIAVDKGQFLNQNFQKSQVTQLPPMQEPHGISLSSVGFQEKLPSVSVGQIPTQPSASQSQPAVNTPYPASTGQQFVQTNPQMTSTQTCYGMPSSSVSSAIMTEHFSQPSGPQSAPIPTYQSHGIPGVLNPLYPQQMTQQQLQNAFQTSSSVSVDSALSPTKVSNLKRNEQQPQVEVKPGSISGVTPALGPQQLPLAYQVQQGSQMFPTQTSQPGEQLSGAVNRVDRSDRSESNANIHGGPSQQMRIQSGQPVAGEGYQNILHPQGQQQVSQQPQQPIPQQAPHQTVLQNPVHLAQQQGQQLLYQQPQQYVQHQVQHSSEQFYGVPSGSFKPEGLSQQSLYRDESVTAPLSVNTLDSFPQVQSVSQVLNGPQSGAYQQEAPSVMQNYQQVNQPQQMPEVHPVSAPFVQRERQQVSAVSAGHSGSSATMTSPQPQPSQPSFPSQGISQPVVRSSQGYQPSSQFQVSLQGQLPPGSQVQTYHGASYPTVYSSAGQTSQNVGQPVMTQANQLQSQTSVHGVHTLPSAPAVHSSASQHQSSQGSLTHNFVGQQTPSQLPQQIQPAAVMPKEAQPHKQTNLHLIMPQSVTTNAFAGSGTESSFPNQLPTQGCVQYPGQPIHQFHPQVIAQQSIGIQQQATPPVVQPKTQQNLHIPAQGLAAQQAPAVVAQLPQQSRAPSALSQQLEGQNVQPILQAALQIQGQVLSLDFSDSAAGGNSVAIDNRIVQALDIVKDRLIHAVREEVDELKLKIEELNLRIRELESENSILRGAVPSELLAQIDSQKPGGGQN